MKRALIGSGGFAKEVKAHIGDPTMKCFVSDRYYVPNNNKNIYPISQFDPNEYEVLVAVGDSTERNYIVQTLPQETKFFSFIHPSAIILGNDVEIGEGSIVCAGAIVTANVKIGKHAHLNLHTTVGHDCVIGHFFTTAPGAKISGNCTVGDCVYVGTNASIKQRIEICNSVVIGLNSGVVKNITESGTYVGTPSVKIKNEKRSIIYL
jgi:sugar O-acyltransferase (sialic acid O-acetyltransferase NeuD family)